MIPNIGDNGMIVVKSNKHVLLCCVMSLLVYFTAGNLSAQEKKPDEVSIGLYIIDIYNINFKEKELTADFYLWFNYLNPELHPLKTFEIINTKRTEKLGEPVIKKSANGMIYELVKCKALIKKNWDITAYPFDEHTVEIFIEDTASDATSMVFVPDTKNSNIDKSCNIVNWKIKDFNIREEKYIWETTYADPDIASSNDSGKESGVSNQGSSSYSRLIISFNLEKTGSILIRFIKTFAILEIIILISFIALFLPPDNITQRYNLLVGSIFSTIASQYVMGSKLPESSTETFVDFLYNLSYLYIFINIVKSTLTSILFQKNNKEMAVKIDKYSLFTIIPSYFILVVGMIIYLMVSQHR